MESAAVSVDKPKRRVEKWLNQWLCIEITDGRVLTGRFMCTDNSPNVILAETVECRKCTSSNESDFMRSVGTVMIPGSHIQRITLIEDPLNA